MAEGKYSLKLAAVDAFSSTFSEFGKKAGKMQDVLKAQQAELRKLSAQAKSVDGYVKLSADLKKTETALSSARAEQARLSREQATASNRAAELSAAYAKAVIATKALEAATNASAVDVAFARAEQQRLGKELDSVTSASKKLDAQHDKATAGVKSLERAQRREREGLTTLGSALTTAGISTDKLAAEQVRLKAATESANAALGAQRAKLDAINAKQGRIDNNRSARADLRGQIVETAAVGYVASRPIKQAMELETAMADVGKVINFEGDQRKQMAAENLRLASDRLIASGGISAVDLSKIEYAAGQSGIGNDQKGADGKVDSAAKQKAIMEFTRDAAIMASAFDIEAKEAGETMAGWRASMALSRAQTLDLADSTNYLGNNFNATAADIASVVKRYGAVGKASGMTPEQTAALSAAFLNPGTEKEIAGTGFKNFTAALTKGSAATKGQKTAWKELGFDPEDLAKDMQGNAPQTIMKVLESIRDQPVEKQAAVATELFGSESIGAIQPLLQNLKEVDRAFKMVADKSKYATSVIGDQGSMMQEAVGVANTSKTGWNAFTARLTRLSTVVGDSMLPALNAVLVPLGALVDGLSWAAETFPGITSALAVTAGALAAAKVGVLGLKFAGLLVGQAFNKAGLARAKLDGTTATTATSANLAVTRLNAAINGLGGGVGGVDADGKGKGKKGAAARARRGGLAGRAAGIASTAGKAAVPLMVVGAGIEVVNGLQDGDSKAVGSGIGSGGGALAGAWAGGSAGAAIGTLIMPGVGTAVGGAVGSLAGGIAGSELGSWLGEKLGELVDRLTSPDEVSKEIAAPADNRQITFAPVISINGQDAANAQQLADMVARKMHEQFLPMMVASPLAVRRGASLTDGGG